MCRGGGIVTVPRVCGAYSTPRISLVEARSAVRAVSTRVSDVCGQVGTRRGAYRVGAWEGILGGYYPSTLPVPSYWYCQGPTDGPYVRYRVPEALRGPAGPLRTPQLPHPSIWPPGAK